LDATLCSDRESIRRRVDETRANGGDAVLQEVVRGRQIHYMVVLDAAGDLVTDVQTVSERLVLPGPEMGLRVRSVSVPVDERLREQSAALMNELGWVGMTSLMLLLPERGGEALLTDFNARLTNAGKQYIAAGANFPDLWARLATGRPLPPIRPAKVGVRFHWLEGDLRRAFVQRRGGLLHDVVDCLAYARGAVHTLWRRDDPEPAMFHGLRTARAASFILRGRLRDAAGSLRDHSVVTRRPTS